MIRNLKALGLALVAVFALSAVVASAASAQNGILTSTGPVTLIGTQTGTANQLSAFGGTTTCSNTTTKYTGHKYNVTPHTFIPNNSSTFTVTPHYMGCTSKIGAAIFPTTIDMNGCDYDFHLEGTTPGVDTYTLKAFVTCPTGQHITITIFATAAKHTANEPFCDITITENAGGYVGLHATETTSPTKKVVINGEIKELISADKSSPTGSILCPTESTNTASLVQDVELEGKNEAGSTTGISLSHL
jgi:hypothetical protein